MKTHYIDVIHKKCASFESRVRATTSSLLLAMLQSSKETFCGLLPHPTRRGYDVNNAFFDEGNVYMNDKKQLLCADDAEEMHANEAAMIPCIVSGCKIKLSKLSDMTNHYNQYHFHTCVECNRSFPGERLLSLHISELHDSYFHVMSLKKPSYVCLVDGCDLLSISDEARTLHLKISHLFPESFRFHHPIRKNKKKKKAVKGLLSIISDTAASMTTTDEMSMDKDKKLSGGSSIISSGGGGVTRNKNKLKGLSTVISDTVNEMSIDTIPFDNGLSGRNDTECRSKPSRPGGLGRGHTGGSIIRGDSCSVTGDSNDMIIDDLVTSFDNNMKIPHHISFGRKHKKGFIREKTR